MRTSPLIILLLLFSFTFRADYLFTSTTANIKEEPDTASATLEHVEEGVRLELLDNGTQSNEYYHVKSAAGIKGWVYRNRVRRYADDEGPSPGTGGSSSSTPTTDEDVEVTTIYVGAGLSCLIKLHNNKYIIFDAGIAGPVTTFLSTVLTADAPIEMLILSHTDTDHWGAVENIIKTYKVKKVYRTSYRDETMPYPGVYDKGLKAINADNTIEDHDLGDEGNLQPGTVLYDQDGVKLTALCGFKEPVAAWNVKEAEANNAISIAVRLEYANHSIIIAGDAVGHDECKDDNACIATEKFMLDNPTSAALLDADVLVAGHHGSEGSSCGLFIDKVSPEFVIFSAGNMHRHPRQSTAERFVNRGVAEHNIFRTDRGKLQDQTSDEVCKQEYDDGTATGTDTSGDDHIMVILPKTGKVKVGYLSL